MADDRPTNGTVRWRDLDERDQRLRSNHAQDMDKFEASVRERLDKAHLYHTDLATTQTGAIASLAERVRSVEDVINQQRGARNLVYALIGTNLLLAVATAVALFAALG